MQRNVVNLLTVLGILFVITACVCQSDRNKDSGQTNSDPSGPIKVSAEKSPDKTSSSTDKKKDEGDFIAQHETVSNSRYAEIDKQIKQGKLLERAADGLNQALILPHDIYLKSKDCGDVNAFYNPDDHSVTVCYELMEQFFHDFKSEGYDDKKAYDMMFDAIRFVFLHEIGHALIDTYKLPVTANEEDAADRCSSFINLEELGEDGVKAVLAAAEAFQVESRASGTHPHNMADEHLLQEQRFYNALCMLYGSNPDKYDAILTKGFLPKERAARCPTEYQKTVESWQTLLEPWRK
jgi:Putative metallopeptidase